MIWPMGDKNKYVTRTTDTDGLIMLENMDPGIYVVTETKPPPGYLPAEPDSQEIYIAAGQSRG